MDLLIERLQPYLPSRRLKFGFRGCPFQSQSLGFVGKGGVVTGNEGLSQSSDLVTCPKNRQPLRISRARVCNEAKGRATHERFEFGHSKAYISRLLQQSAWLWVTRTCSQRLDLVEQLHQLSIRRELSIRK